MSEKITYPPQMKDVVRLEACDKIKEAELLLRDIASDLDWETEDQKHASSDAVILFRMRMRWMNR